MSDFERALQKIRMDSTDRLIVGCCDSRLGPTGPTGATGPQGPTTITVGTTTTGNPGEDASVTNSGTSQNLVLDFVIPTGSIGPTGLTGATGPTGPTA